MLAGARERILSQSRARRELTLFLVLIAVGIFVLPFLIWTAGFLTLGPYEGGGPFALLADFLTGLGRGVLVFWVVALGPWVFTLLLRLFWYWVRVSRTAG